MSITIRDLAKHLGTSHSTVSRVLNNRGDEYKITYKLQQKIINAACDLGYRRNSIARALSTGQTNIIGVWMPSIRDPYYAKCLSLLKTRLEQDKYEVIFVELNPEEIKTHKISNVSKWPMDGILIYDAFPFLGNFFESDLSSTKPFVSMGVYHSQNLDYVGVDLYQAAKEAVEYFVKTGCRRIAYFALIAEGYEKDKRFESYKEVLSAAGLDIEVIGSSNFNRSSFRKDFRDYIVKNGHPNAVFCQNDDMAIAAYRALLDLGLKIPEDVSIIGCNGNEDIEYLEVPLSTINIPISKTIEAAWKLLKNRMESPDAPKEHILFKAELEIRESCLKLI